MKSHPFKRYEKCVRMTKFTLNIFESLVSVVLISTLSDDKLSDVAQPIRLLTQPDTSVEHFVSIHEQWLNDGDLPRPVAHV